MINDERMRGDRWIVMRGGQGESRIIMRKNSEADMMRDEAPPPIETRHAPPSPKKELSRAVRSVPAIVTTTTKSSTPGIDMAPFKKMKMIPLVRATEPGRAQSVNQSLWL